MIRAGLLLMAALLPAGVRADAQVSEAAYGGYAVVALAGEPALMAYDGHGDWALLSGAALVYGGLRLSDALERKPHSVPPELKDFDLLGGVLALPAFLFQQAYPFWGLVRATDERDGGRILRSLPFAALSLFNLLAISHDLRPREGGPKIRLGPWGDNGLQASLDF